jgi:hypothetical protein
MLAVIKCIYKSYWNGKKIIVNTRWQGSRKVYNFYAEDSPQSLISLGTILVDQRDGDVTERLDNTRVSRDIYESGILWKPR